MLLDLEKVAFLLLARGKRKAVMAESLINQVVVWKRAELMKRLQELEQILSSMQGFLMALLARESCSLAESQQTMMVLERVMEIHLIALSEMRVDKIFVVVAMMKADHQ